MPDSSTSFSDVVTSTIRTIVPYLVGLLATWLASRGVDVSEATEASLAGAFTFVVGSIYYVAVRWLESKYPKVGWLLGSPKKPSYQS